MESKEYSNPSNCSSDNVAACLQELKTPQKCHRCINDSVIYLLRGKKEDCIRLCMECALGTDIGNF